MSIKTRERKRSGNGDARRSHPGFRQILSLQKEFLYCRISHALPQPNSAHGHSYRPRAYGILVRSLKVGAHRPKLVKKLTEKRISDNCHAKNDRRIYYIGFPSDIGLDREFPLVQSVPLVGMMLVAHCFQPLWGI